MQIEMSAVQSTFVTYNDIKQSYYLHFNANKSVCHYVTQDYIIGKTCSASELTIKINVKYIRNCH